MRKIISIILIAIMFSLGVSSVYAAPVAGDTFTAKDIVYSLNEIGYTAAVINLEDLQAFCISVGAPASTSSFLSAYSGETFYPVAATYTTEIYRVFYAPFSADISNIDGFFSNSFRDVNNRFKLTVDSGGTDFVCMYGYWGNSSTTPKKDFDRYSYFNYPTLDNVLVLDSVHVTLPSSSMSYTYLQHAPIEVINGGLVSLQSGNALVIDTLGGNVSQIGLFTTMPVKSSVFSAFRSGASYFVTNDLNSIKSIDFNTHAFTWDKQEGTTGLLGQTNKGVYTINNPSGGRYIVIVNPRYMPRGSDNFLTNNPITVAISGTYRNLFRYSLSQSDATLVTLSDEGESMIETNEGGTNSFGGSFTFDQLPNTDPLPSDTPVIAWGTGNTPDYSEVPSLDGSVIGQATENLQGIRSDFNGFFGVIRDCISWLPPQLITLLVAAMSFLVAVGIVKALL